jgi:uncharacterized membrane protein
MKPYRPHLFVALALLLGVATGARSAPIPNERISADAKWLIHADLDGFRASQAGQYVQKTMLNEALEGLSGQLKFDVPALMQKFKSVTAYGTDFAKDPQANLASAVLIIQTDDEAQKIVEGALAAQLLADEEGKGPLKKLQTEPYPLYNVGKDLYGAILPNGVITLGKSRERIEFAREVLIGKAPSLKGSKSFADFPAAPDALILLGVAEGFNDAMPSLPQAKVLKMADGARIVLGEKQDRIFAEVSLKGKTTEVVGQIQQVLQGLVALASLGQPEDKDLAELVKGIKVTANDKVVSVGVGFPVARALEKLAEHKDHQDRPVKKTKTAKRKAKPQPVESEEAEPPPPPTKKADAK